MRTGTGDFAPVSSTLTMEVWENSPTLGQMPGTDPDGSDDLYRYQIVVEPESPASLVLTDEVAALFRHNQAGGFTYTATSVSATVARVAQAMANLPADFDFNAVRRTTEHPGYRADSFQFKIVDKSGLVSEVATVFINVRLTRESNTPPISSPLAFVTSENVALSGAFVKFQSLDAESPDNLRHAIHETEAGVVPVWATPVLGKITPLDPTNVNDPRFVYTPKPFFHGTETLQYVAIDAHGARSTPVDLVVTVTEVNQPPHGACSVGSAMDTDVKLAMGAGTEFTVGAASGAELASDVQAKATADIGTLRETFVSYQRVIVELNRMANMSATWNETEIDTAGVNATDLAAVLHIPGGASATTALACGDSATVIRAPHTADVGLVLLAFDVDNLLGTPLTYLLKQTPVRSDDGRAAGAVFKWQPPVRVNDSDASAGFAHSFSDDVFMDANKLSVGPIQPFPNTNDIPALVFRPATGINGEVVLRWAAVDSFGAEGPESVTTFKVQCPGGETVAGPLCTPCAPGTYNDRVLLDQTTCSECPPGTQTPVPGSTRCSACPPDTYTALPGTGTCGACPANMKSNSGASALTACRCEIGTVQLSDTQCWPCDLFRTKCEVLGRELPIPYKGHWQDPGEPRRTYDCIPSAACVEKFTEDEVKDRRCAGQRFKRLSGDVAYVGDGCYQCQANHYRHAGHCHSCGSASRARWRLAALVLLYAAIVGLLLEVAGSPAVGALGILVTFLQISASMKYLSIAWPKDMYAWLTVTSASYLDLELWAGECVSGKWSYFAKYTVAMVQPLVWLFIIAISVFARVARRVAVEYHRRARDAVRTRVNVSRRWLHGQVDPDATQWKETANARHGLPLDRPTLVDESDVFTAAEKLDLRNASGSDFDRVMDYAKYKGVTMDDMDVADAEIPLGKRPLRYLVKVSIGPFPNPPPCLPIQD